MWSLLLILFYHRYHCNHNIILFLFLFYIKICYRYQSCHIAIIMIHDHHIVVFFFYHYIDFNVYIFYYFDKLIYYYYFFKFSLNAVFWTKKKKKKCQIAEMCQNILCQTKHCLTSPLVTIYLSWWAPTHNQINICLSDADLHGDGLHSWGGLRAGFGANWEKK